MSDVNARLALAVSTIAFGYFLRMIGLVDIDVGKALLKVLFNATLPSVLLVVFASLTFDAQSASVAACALAQAGVLFLAHFAFRGGGREPKDLALMTGSTVGVNLGTFCYPLVDAVWGAEGLTRLVLFDAVKAAQKDGIDLVLCDTSGRLHTNEGLMQELAGCARAVGKAQEGAPDEVS